jgi:hypothetical protein
MLYLDEACSRNTPNLTLAMLTRQALHWDGINLEEVPPVRADIDEEPRADDPGDAVRDILGRDDPFARAVVAELALRYRDLVRALKGQKLRTGSGAARELDHADGCAQRPHRPHVILPFEKRRLVSLLGMTPENLSRGFNALASHGIMTEGRAIVIKDRENCNACPHADPLIEEVIPVKRRKRKACCKVRY